MDYIYIGASEKFLLALFNLCMYVYVTRIPLLGAILLLLVLLLLLSFSMLSPMLLRMPTDRVYGARENKRTTHTHNKKTRLLQRKQKSA